jgi:NifU-like protein involved in Fe-S cluster formation
MRYSELTRRYFQATPCVGVLFAEPSAAAGLFRASAGRRERGTWVQFDLKVQEGGVRDARFLAFGCPHTIAVASWVAEHGRGALSVALPEPVQELRERFGVPPEKLGKLLVVEDAWLAAIRAAMGLGA